MKQTPRNSTIRIAALALRAVVAFVCAPASLLAAPPASTLDREPSVWAPLHSPPPERLPLVIASRPDAAYAVPAVPSFEPEPQADIHSHMAEWAPATTAPPGPPLPTVAFDDAMPCCTPCAPRRTPGLRESLFAPAPLEWLSEPLSLSKFAGGFGSNEPIENELRRGIGAMEGLRFGWDFAPRWGVESRLGFSRVSFGAPAPGALVSHENFIIWDAAFCFYPWPDSMWRPFLFAGAGMTDVRYIDQVGRDLHQSLFHVPLGFGIKRQIYGRHAFRIDVGDNLLFADSRPPQLLHNVSITAGFELRFGGGWNWVHFGGTSE